MNEVVPGRKYHQRQDQRQPHAKAVFLRALGLRSDEEILKTFYTVDTIQVKDNRVWRNGTLIEEPYVKPGSFRPDPSTHCGYLYGCEPLVVPPNSYFVMGDNRDNSQDSRYWGFVKREKIRGKAFLIYWSWNGESHWPRWSRLGNWLP